MLLSMYFLFEKADITVLVCIMAEIVFSSAAFFLIGCLSDSNWTLMLLFVYVCA